MKNERFGNILHNAWNPPTDGSPMLRLCLKLKRLKPLLKALNVDCYSNISVRVNEAKDELTRLQELCFSHPFDDHIQSLEKVALCKHVDLRNAEEAFKKQKSRSQWLALGDQNTKKKSQEGCC